MFHFKALTEEDYYDERQQILWQILTAQLEGAHQQMMADIGLPEVRLLEADQIQALKRQTGGLRPDVRPASKSARPGPSPARPQMSVLRGQGL